MNNDRFLLCTDGLTKHVPESDEIATAKEEDLASLLDQMHQLSLSQVSLAYIIAEFK